jgi:alpha-tubulin suppressor-like RCC1 family protein
LSGKIVVGVVAGPSFSLCRVSTGQVYGFGSNADGELGDGTKVCFNSLSINSIGGKERARIAKNVWSISQ